MTGQIRDDRNRRYIVHSSKPRRDHTFINKKEMKTDFLQRMLEPIKPGPQVDAAEFINAARDDATRLI